MDKVDQRIATENAREDARFLIGCGFLENDKEWIQAWYGYDLKWSEGDRGYVTIPLKEVEPFVSEAQTCPEVFRLAKFVAGTRLGNRVDMPEPLRTLVSRYLYGKFVPPKGTAGRKRNWGRDFIVIRVMQHVLQANEVPATANRKRCGQRRTVVSASQIMEAALAEVEGLKHLNAERIQKIWGSPKAQEDHEEAHYLYFKGMLEDEKELIRI